ncbi:MAG TPA: hypothetical protein VFO20_08145 [Propionibacteriaceae bacterium]|nr:hypothetical protein [Propionibacteriaceae bacterium]
MSLLIDAVRRSGQGTDVPQTLQDLPDVVTALLSQMVEHAPTIRHRAALQVAAHASATTEPLLRAALPADAEEASELWEWLRDLTIMEEAQAGIFRTTWPVTSWKPTYAGAIPIPTPNPSSVARISHRPGKGVGRES